MDIPTKGPKYYRELQMITKGQKRLEKVRKDYKIMAKGWKWLQSQEILKRVTKVYIKQQFLRPTLLLAFLSILKWKTENGSHIIIYNFA